MTPKTQTAIRLAPEVKSQLEEAAQRIGISLTAYLTIAGLEKMERDKPAKHRAKK